MNVEGSLVNSSVSLAAIHRNRGDRRSCDRRRPALVRCQRSTESARAQPTHEPLAPWSPICHHESSRKSLLVGGAVCEKTSPAALALDNFQSSSVFCDGKQLRMRFDPALSTVDITSSAAIRHFPP